MKKKSLLVFLLATLSTATVAAVGCDNTHSHSYSPGHDAVSHWEECSCGNRKNIEEHVDVKNNDTQADGKDGKCDVCGLENHTVTFDMGNYADDVEKTVYSGGVPTAPSTENDYAFFKGWYTDKDCTDGNEYDLATPVTGDITVYAKWAEAVLVRFHMNGHGEAISTLKIEEGGKAVKPVNPEAYGFTFGDWYTDSGCTAGNEFDFNTVLYESVDVYAKWTPLFSYIEIGGTGDATFGDKDVVGYIFKAPANGSGRYSVQLGGGAASQACRFTTTQDEDGVYYGKDEASAVKYFDLDAGEEIVFSITRKGDVANDVAVSVVVQEVTDEDLPADGWLAGSYEGASLSFVLLDRENKKLTYNGAEYNATYLGGKTDTLFFDIPSPAGGGARLEFKAKRIKDESNEYEAVALSQLQGSTWKQVDTLYYTPDQRDVNVEEFTGVYKPKENGAVVRDITEICVYPSGNGYIIIQSQKNNFSLGSDGCNFDKGSSALTIKYNYTITAVLDKADHVVGVKVVNTAGGAGTSIAFYDRTGDAPDEVPSKLPISDNTEYWGAKFGLKCMYGNQYWGDSSRAITVTDFDKATNTYTIDANGATYKLVFTGEGDGISIAVYDEADKLLDTLTKYTLDLTDTVAVDNSEVTLTPADFKKGFHHYTISEAGAYSFTFTNESLMIYYNMNGNYATDPNANTEYVNIDNSGEPVFLKSNSVVGVYVGIMSAVPAEVKFSVLKGESVKSPLGWEDNPYVLGLGGLIAEGVKTKEIYYAEFTAPAAGEYAFKIVNNPENYESETTIYGTLWTIGETTVGYENWTYKIGEEKTGLSLAAYKAALPYTLAMTEGQKVKIAFQSVAFGNAYDVFMEVRSKTVSLTELTLNANEGGTLSADGAYKYTGNYPADRAAGIKFTCKNGAKVNFGGKDYTDSLTLNPFELSLGFDVTVNGGTVDYVVVYKEGSERNPIEINSLDTINLAYDGDPVYVKVTAPSDKGIIITTGKVVDSTETYRFCFEYNDVTYGYYMSSDTTAIPYENIYLKLAAGQSAVLKVYCEYANGYENYVSDPVIPLVVSEDNVPDLTQGATTVTAAKKSQSGDIATYEATLNLTAGTNKFYIANSVNTAVSLSAANAFTVILADGSTITPSKVQNGYWCSIGVANKTYFGVTCESAQSMTLSYMVSYGTERAPYEMVLTDGAFTNSFSGRYDNRYYVAKTAGSYLLTFDSGLNVYLNDDETLLTSGKIVNLAAGDLIILTNVDYTSYTFSAHLAIEAETGLYVYNDGEDKVISLNATSITSADVTYTLASINGTTYLFKNADGSTTLTVVYDGETFTLDGHALTPKPMFTEAQAGTYSGNVKYNSDSYPVTLTFGTNGKGTIKAYGRTYEIACEQEGDGYTFSYNTGYSVIKDNFKFNADGTLELTDRRNSSENRVGTLTKQTEVAAEVTYTGKATGADDTTYTVTFVLSGDMKSGSYTVSGGGYTGTGDITLTSTGDNAWSFANSNEFSMDYPSGTITKDGDTLTLEDGGNFYNTCTLTKA